MKPSEVRSNLLYLAEKLNLKDEEYITTFQSRFGPAEWLKPYTSETMERLSLIHI